MIVSPVSVGYKMDWLGGIEVTLCFRDSQKYIVDACFKRVKLSFGVINVSKLQFKALTPYNPPDTKGKGTITLTAQLRSLHIKTLY